MGIPLSGTFSRGFAGPLDEYAFRADVTARNAIPTAARYLYMTCTVAADGKTYRLVGGLTNADWQEVTGGSSAWGDITGTLSAQTDLQTALDNVLIAAEDYADSLALGSVSDRGDYDASGNVFPSTGGSGSAGAIMTGDYWRISVAGTLGGTAVTVGKYIKALADTPGQTSGNWSIYDDPIAKLNVTQTWTKAQTVAQVTVTSSGGSIALDLTASNNFLHALTEDTELLNPSVMIPGMEFKIVFVQHSTANKVITFDTYWHSVDGYVPTLSITPDAVNVLTGSVNTATHITYNLIKHGIA